MAGAVIDRSIAGSAQGRLIALRGSAVAQRLLTIDDFWTAQLEDVADRGEVSEEDLAVLRDAAFHLNQGLAEVQPLADEIRMMLDGDLAEAHVDEALDRIAEFSSQSEMSAQWREALPDYSFRGAAITACAYIVEQAPRETSEIQMKLSQLEAGELPPGDFRLPLRCSLVLLIAAGAVVGIVAGAGAVVAGGAVGAALTFTYVSAGGWTVSTVVAAGVAWSKERCPRALGAIAGSER